MQTQVTQNLFITYFKYTGITSRPSSVNIFLSEVAYKEIKELLENMQTEDVQKISDIILQEAIDNGFGMAKDDMTVIVAKLEKI